MNCAGIRAALVVVLAVGISRNSTAAELAFDKPAARAYLDSRTSAWLAWDQAKSQGGGGTRCISCHTSLPAALAQPRLGEATAPEKELIANVAARVKSWDAIAAWEKDGEAKGAIRPYYDEDEPSQRKADALATESVLNALVLVNHDAARHGGRLSAESRRALDILWSQQNERGCWNWLDFGIRPWERDAEYLGAALAAVAVGKAGTAYRDADLQPQNRGKLDKLCGYLASNFSKQPLHNRLFAVWASTVLRGVVEEPARRATIEEVLSLGAGDDAWSITSLARTPGGDETWPAAHSLPAGAAQDGYATALVAFVLKEAKSESPRLKQARAWLVEKRVASGEGPVIYLNRRRDPASDDSDEAMIGKFMRDAAAAFAVMALSD